MTDPTATLAASLAMFQDSLSGAVGPWYETDIARYALAASGTLLFIVIIARFPNFLSWLRARNKPVLDPIDLEQVTYGIPIVIIDLRDPRDYNNPKGHLRGSVNIPIAQLGRRMNEVPKDKKTLVVLVDGSDYLSHLAAPIMVQAGYPYVRVLKGGMRAWRALKLPVAVTGEKVPVRTAPGAKP